MESWNSNPEKIPIEKLGPFKNDFDHIFDGKLKNTLIQVVKKLTKVKRMTDVPYATHPLQMVFLLKWILPNTETCFITSSLYALLHDYLEEGDGINLEGFKKMGNDFPFLKDEVLSAIYLSEPPIVTQSIDPALKTPEENKMLKDISYLLHVTMAFEKNHKSSYANASIVDKIDNALDLDYIFQSSRFNTKEKQYKKLINKSAYYRLVKDMIGPEAHPSLVSFFSETIHYIQNQYDLNSTVIEKEYEKFIQFRARYEAILKKKILECHSFLMFE